MEAAEKRAKRPKLKALVVEASKALARLDAGRLEELAQMCEALNREQPPVSAEERERWAREAREAVGEMAVLGRVLEATRTNLKVMQRLRELRTGLIEYRESAGWTGTGRRHGDD